MAESELRIVIRSCAANERSKKPTFRSLHRRRRLAAVEVYMARFGHTEFVVPFSLRRLEPLPHMWLARGYAWFKERSNQSFKPTSTPPLRSGVAAA